MVLANQFAGFVIGFDPEIFSTPQTITVAAESLKLSDTVLTTASISLAADVTVSGGNAVRVFLVDAEVTAAASPALTISGGIDDR